MLKQDNLVLEVILAPRSCCLFQQTSARVCGQYSQLRTHTATQLTEERPADSVLEVACVWGHIITSDAAQFCLTLCNPMDCSLPGSSVHGIFLERILEWVAISFSKGFS